MNTLTNRLMKEGRLTFLGIVGLVLSGFLLAYLSVEFAPWPWLKIVGLSIGLGVAAVGGFSGRANAIGVPPPFTSDPLGWRKAKRNYEHEITPESEDSEKK